MPKDHTFSLDTWLSELELSPEDRNLIKSKLDTEKNIKALEGNQLRQSDYSFRMSKVQEAELATKAKDEAADKYALELEQWKTEQERLYGGSNTDIARMKGENTALTEYLKSQGIDPATLGINTPPKVETKVEDKPDVDLSNYLTKDLGMALARWPIVFANLTNRYNTLFGKSMTEEQANGFMDAVMASKDRPEVVFDNHFKVAERKVELENADREKFRADTRKEIEAQVRSEVLSQRFVPTSPLGNSPAIATFGVAGKTNADQSWLTDAVNDYNQRVSSRQ